MPAVLFHINHEHTAIVDSEDVQWLKEFDWQPMRKRRCYYAVCVVATYNKPRIIWMHRLVNNSPAGMVCHHRDRNTMNNTKQNLVNMPRKEHMLLHRDNPCLIKYQNGPGLGNQEASPGGTTPAEEIANGTT